MNTVDVYLNKCVFADDDEWMKGQKGFGRESQKWGEASYQLLNMTFPGWACGPQQGRHLCACLSSLFALQARWLNYLQQGTSPRDSQHSLLQPAKTCPSWDPVAWGLKPKHPAAVSTLSLALCDPPPAAPSYTPVTFSPGRTDHTCFTTGMRDLEGFVSVYTVK